MTQRRISRSSFRRFVVRQTVIGVVINTLISTVPPLLFDTVAHDAAARAVRVVAVGLTPQFFMNGLMSALVPSVVLWRAQSLSRTGAEAVPVCVRHLAVVTPLLAIGSTILTLALIHLLVAPFAPGGLDASAVLVLRASEAALTTLIVTPFAIILLAQAVGPLRAAHPKSAS